MNPWHLRQAARVLRAGGIVAYPTEAVYGLGCDPFAADAVMRLLALKRRHWEKGLILIAADRNQLTPFILPLDGTISARLDKTWPGPITWLVPSRPDVPSWLKGSHDTIAVRVTAHPVAAELCRVFGGALVSTSANVSGRPPARSALDVRRIFDQHVDYVIHGPLGGQERPTEIRDARTGAIVRSP